MHYLFDSENAVKTCEVAHINMYIQWPKVFEFRHQLNEMLKCERYQIGDRILWHS